MWVVVDLLGGMCGGVGRMLKMFVMVLREVGIWKRRGGRSYCL